MGLGAFWRHEKQRRRKGPEDRFDLPSPSSPPPVRLPANEAVIGQSAHELVEHYGIPLAPGGIAADASEAAAIAREAGYPVVAKIVSPQWTHKSDRGGVLTNVASEKELMEAFGNLQKFFLQQTPDGHLNGILVQKQMEGFELLFGIKKDPQLGPVLVAGTGGIYTEILKDVAYSLVPVGRSDAERMLRSLRVYPILKGMRGREGAHWPALMDIMIALSEMGCDCPEIKELDLNPVIANAEGAWCVDCRIVTE
jgi:acetyltransferase